MIKNEELVMNDSGVVMPCFEVPKMTEKNIKKYSKYLLSWSEFKPRTFHIQ
jgi:hypothetical protein